MVYLTKIYEISSLEEAEKREKIYEELKKRCFMYYLEIRKKLIGWEKVRNVISVSSCAAKSVLIWVSNWCNLYIK